MVELVQDEGQHHGHATPVKLHFDEQGEALARGSWHTCLLQGRVKAVNTTNRPRPPRWESVSTGKDNCNRTKHGTLLKATH